MRPDARIITGVVIATAGMVVWKAIGPGGFWPDFIAASLVFSFLFLMLRWSATKQSVDQDLGRGHRHETRVTPQWDAALLATHEAVAAFVGTGAVDSLSQRVAEDPVAARLAPIINAQAPPPTRLIHPGWSYLGLAASIIIIVASLCSSAVQGLGAPIRSAWSVGLIGAGAIGYFRFLNRFGAPWWAGTIWGLGCLAGVLLGFALIDGALRFFFFDVPEFTVPILTALVLFTFVAYPHAKRSKPSFVVDRVDNDVIANVRSKNVRQAITKAVIGAIFMGVLLALLSVQAIRGDVRSTFETIFGVIPGLVIGLAAPNLARALGVAIGGPGALRRLQTQRDERSRRLIRILTDVTP